MRMLRWLGCMTVALAGCWLPAPRAEAQSLRRDLLWTELSLASSVGTLGDATSLGVGPHVRASASFLELLRSPSEDKLRFSDWWALDFGAGRLSHSETDTPAWIDFRIELTLRAVYEVSSDLELYLRAGYATGANTARGDLGPGEPPNYDLLLLVLGGRWERFVGELGYGVPGTEGGTDGANYQVASLAYEVDWGSLVQYIGVRLERHAQLIYDEGDLSLFNARIFVGSY